MTGVSCVPTSPTRGTPWRRSNAFASRLSVRALSGPRKHPSRNILSVDYRCACQAGSAPQDTCIQPRRSAALRLGEMVSVQPVYVLANARDPQASLRLLPLGPEPLDRGNAGRVAWLPPDWSGRESPLLSQLEGRPRPMWNQNRVGVREACEKLRPHHRYAQTLDTDCVARVGCPWWT